MKKRWTAALASALALTACLAAGTATVSAQDDSASASAARCGGNAFSPVKRNNKLISKANLRCTGDVARMTLKACLEQQVGFKFKTVECKRVTRRGPGGLFAKVEHGCAPSVDRKFRTRAFLFLRDVSGETATGKAVSPTPVFPNRC
jgi:hypothetical protein